MAWKSFLNAEFSYSGVCSCPKHYLSLIKMENISLGVFCNFSHDEVSVINYEKISFFLLSDCCLICKFNTEKKSLLEGLNTQNVLEQKKRAK